MCEFLQKVSNRICQTKREKRRVSERYTKKKNSEDECEERNRVACREHPPAGWTTTDQRELQTTIDVALAETGS